MFGQSAAGKNASKQYRFAAGKIQRSKKKHLATAKNKFAAERIHSRRSGKNDTAAGKTVGGKEKNVRGRKHPATEKTQLCSRKNRRNRKKQIRRKTTNQSFVLLFAVRCSLFVQYVRLIHLVGRWFVVDLGCALCPTLSWGVC